MIALMILQTIVCMLLVAVILMQAGRGGGLTEGFAAAENVFGARTNEFMIRFTVVLASIFLVTSLSLAYLSARRDQSLMDRLMDKTKEPDIKINIPLDDPKAVEAPAPAEPVVTAPEAVAPVTPSAETK